MDPTIQIDLSSVAGIVALTMTLVHLLKPRLGRITFLQELPVWVYVVGVSGGLTWLSHDVLHKLDGDLISLMVQAVFSAMAASGLVEWWRAGSDPVAESSSAVRAEEKAIARRGGMYLIPILLAVGLAASGCAGKTKAIAVQADSAIYTLLSTVQAGADAITKADCQPGQPCLTTAARRELSPSLLKALRLGKAFNGAVSASNPMQAIGPLLDALRELRGVLERLVPAAARASLLQNLDKAIGLVPAGGQ